MRRLAFMAVLAMALFAAGCSYLAGVRQRPDISVAGLELVELGMFEQRYMLKLRIQNPNDVELPVDGMAFSVELNGQNFARGVSDQAVTVPRMGEAVIEVHAVSTLGKVWKQLRELQKGTRDRMDYRLSGRILLQGLGSIPFEQSGEVALP